MQCLVKIGVIAMSFTVVTGAARTSTRQFLSIPPSDVSARVEPDTTMGQYYTITYHLPDDLHARVLDRAVLELFLDVRAKARDGYVNEAPMVQVYALKAPYAESVEPEDLDATSRAVRAVALGGGRRVLIDVTGIVRAHLDGALQNNGLVVGSLIGTRDGDFTLVTNRLPDGAVGRLRIYTTTRTSR